MSPRNKANTDLVKHCLLLVADTRVDIGKLERLVLMVMLQGGQFVPTFMAWDLSMGMSPNCWVAWQSEEEVRHDIERSAGLCSRSWSTLVSTRLSSLQG